MHWAGIWRFRRGLLGDGPRLDLFSIDFLVTVFPLFTSLPSFYSSLLHLSDGMGAASWFA